MSTRRPATSPRELSGLGPSIGDRDPAVDPSIGHGRTRASSPNYRQCWRTSFHGLLGWLKAVAPWSRAGCGTSVLYSASLWFMDRG